MSGLASDKQEIPVAIDTLDATDSVDRQIQVSYGLSAQIAAVLREVSGGGAGAYRMPEHVDAANRVTYEALVDNAFSALTDLLAALRAITVQA